MVSGVWFSGKIVSARPSAIFRETYPSRCFLPSLSFDDFLSSHFSNPPASSALPEHKRFRNFPLKNLYFAMLSCQKSASFCLRFFSSARQRISTCFPRLKGKPDKTTLSGSSITIFLRTTVIGSPSALKQLSRETI